MHTALDKGPRIMEARHARRASDCDGYCSHSVLVGKSIAALDDAWTPSFRRLRTLCRHLHIVDNVRPMCSASSGGAVGLFYGDPAGKASSQLRRAIDPAPQRCARMSDARMRVVPRANLLVRMPLGRYGACGAGQWLVRRWTRTPCFGGWHGMGA